MLDRLEPGEQFARHPGAVDPPHVMLRVSPQLNKRSASAATLTTRYACSTGVVISERYIKVCFRNYQSGGLSYVNTHAASNAINTII